MSRTSFIVVAGALCAFSGCKDKKKPAAQPPPVASAQPPTTEAPAQAEVPAVAEPPAQLDRSITDGALARDGAVAALILRPTDGAEINVTEPGGLFLFVRPKQVAKTAMTGEWTTFRLFGSGDRFGLRQAWTFSGDTLKVDRVNKEAKSSSHAVSFNGSHYTVSQSGAEGSTGWSETGVTSGRFFFGLRVVDKPPAPTNGEGDAENAGGESNRNLSLGIKRQRCGAEAIEGTWREFRLAKKQLVEWKLGKGSFSFSVWDGQQSGDPKLVRKGSFAFDAAACAAVFKPAVESEDGGGAPSFETYFDPDSGMAIGAIGKPTEYFQVGVWFRASTDAPKAERSGQWAVLRYPPRVGFVTVDDRGAFEGSIGDSWDQPMAEVSGGLELGNKVGGSWVAKPATPPAAPAAAAPVGLPEAAPEAAPEPAPGSPPQ